MLIYCKYCQVIHWLVDSLIVIMTSEFIGYLYQMLALGGISVKIEIKESKKRTGRRSPVSLQDDENEVLIVILNKCDLLDNKLCPVITTG